MQELAARAKQLVLERDFAEAVRACRRLLLSRPDDDDARLLLGRALIATERFDEVRVEMMSLIRRRPESATAHRLLGESFLRAKQPKRGEEYLRRALELDPDDDEAAELLEDLAADPPPVSATVERWFDSAGVATIETPASFFDDGSEDRPATAPIQDAPPSIQIDPELAAVAESMALLKSEDTVTSVETPEPDGGEETDTVTNPDAESPPAESPAAKPPVRRPKQTMMGIAGLGQLAPGLASASKPERGAFGAETTSELGLDDLEQVASASPPPTPKAAVTSELDAGDLEPVDSKACFEPLDAEPMEAEATSVAGAGLAPLDEEATRLRAPPQRDEPEHTRDLRSRAAVVPAASVPAPVAARPRVVTLPPPPGPPPNVSAPPGAASLSPVAAPPIAAPP
ncbi:MAG: tetratricopeptide repeat protein, partial [Deltaproteobacteria bacterium]|nr:tetratricopeptide repeat protein [Deltaproteobacteria bacterium]